MRALAAIDVARRIDQRATEELCRDAGIEGNHLVRDGALRIPGLATVKRAVEFDRVGAVVVPRDVQLALSANKRNGTDRQTLPVRVVGASGGERRAVITRGR